MINNKLKTYALKRASDVVDEYGQRKKGTYSTIANVKLSIVYSGEAAINNPHFENVDYVGISFGGFKDFQKGDKVDDKYKVEQVIEAGRAMYLMLVNV